MSSNYTNKLLITLSTFVLFSCQDVLQSYKTKNDIIYDQSILELKETLDFNYYKNTKNNIFDYYSQGSIIYDFTQKKFDRIKIKNYSNIIDETITLNLIYDEKYFYSINSKGNILKFNKNTAEIIEEIELIFDKSKHNIPVSFSLINDDFIIGFKSGRIIKSTKQGKIVWQFKQENFLNTPIKITNDFIIILYPEDIILLSHDDGEVLYKKNYRDGNIIQSNGGKVASYFNFLYFILPNSSFGSIDTFFYEENISKIDSLQIQTSLNNLNDNLHIYQNFLVYLDNGNQINTFDIILNKFILKKHLLNNVNSYGFYNNSLVILKDNLIEFYNIKNGKLFFSINVDKILKKDSNIIKISNINKKLYIFFDSGKILIVENKEVKQLVDLKIRNINYIYNINDKFFVSTKKGITYIY